MSFNDICENRILRKISEFTVFMIWFLNERNRFTVSMYTSIHSYLHKIYTIAHTSDMSLNYGNI